MTNHHITARKILQFRCFCFIIKSLSKSQEEDVIMSNVSTYAELISAIYEKESVINITKDIVLFSPIEISGCSDLEITSSSNCSLTGGITDVKWVKSGAYLTCDADIEPRILIINGFPAEKTSFPADGYLENTDVSGYTWLNSRNGGWDKKPTAYHLTHITLKQEDIPHNFDIENCDIRVIHTWDESTVSIKSYDSASGVVECQNEMAHPAGAFGVHKYQFLNTSYGAPQKGRWFYDRSAKKIFYCPRDGENENNIKSMIPVSNSVILIKNCKNVNVSNVKISLSNSEIGRISGLRAINPRGAIQVENSENISLDKLEIGFSGGQGVKFLSCKNISITNSVIENCASCGIATFECENEHISHNTIKDIGLGDFSAVSVHAGGKSELVYVLDGSKEEHGQTVIENNTIDGSPYCGIACSGGPHIIKNNMVSRCMQTLKDGGAIYCSRAVGTLIKDNYVSDVPSDTAYAYYLDELSENCLVDGNVSVNVNIPFTAHIAKNCTLTNNLFINNDETRLRIVRSENFKMQNNVMVSQGVAIIYIKSYDPDDNYGLKDVLSFCDDVISAPDIKLVPEEDFIPEKCGIIRKTLRCKAENGHFIFTDLPGGICNKYI